MYRNKWINENIFVCICSILIVKKNEKEMLQNEQIKC